MKTSQAVLTVAALSLAAVRADPTITVNATHASPTITCANVRCGWDTQCVMQPAPCPRAPCPVRPTCVAIAAAPSAAPTASPIDNTPVGTTSSGGTGWYDTPVTAATTALLLQALGDRAHYAASIYQPVCVHTVQSVRQHAVAGMEYLFEVNGCPVPFVDSPSALGKCKGANQGCRAAPFEIGLFTQPWTNTLRVDSIARLE